MLAVVPLHQNTLLQDPGRRTSIGRLAVPITETLRNRNNTAGQVAVPPTLRRVWNASG